MRISGGDDYDRGSSSSSSSSNTIEKHQRTKNGNGHLFNEILPPVERTFPFPALSFPFSSLSLSLTLCQSTNLALPSTLKRTCTQWHEKKWVRVNRVSYVSDFMDFDYTFLFLLASFLHCLSLFLSTFLSQSVSWNIVLTFVKWKKKRCETESV